MASQRLVILVCDLCQTEAGEGESDIATHSILVDGAAAELEACGKCWGKHAAGLEKLIEVGRKVPRKKVA